MNSLKKYNKFFRLPSIAYVEFEREEDNPIRHSYIIGGRHRYLIAAGSAVWVEYSEF